MFKLFHLIYLYLKSFCVNSKHSEGNQIFNIQSPSLIFKIIGYNFKTIPVPKSQDKEFFVQVGPEYQNSAHILPKFLRGKDHQNPTPTPTPPSI